MLGRFLCSTEIGAQGSTLKNSIDLGAERCCVSLLAASRLLGRHACRAEWHCERFTPLEEIDLRLPEEKPWTLSRGTKTALDHGGNRYLKAASCHEEDPHLLLPTIGMTGTASGDPWGQLEHGQFTHIN